MLNRIHHTSIICSNYEQSKRFYTDILGLQVIRETFRPERNSYKLDLSLNGKYVIELFSFPITPPRLSRPEATGLRHIAFAVDSLTKVLETLKKSRLVMPPRIENLLIKRAPFLHLFASLHTFAQDAEVFSPDSIRKEMVAVEIATALTIDGSMLEAEWKTARPLISWSAGFRKISVNKTGSGD